LARAARPPPRPRRPHAEPKRCMVATEPPLATPLAHASVAALPAHPQMPVHSAAPQRHSAAAAQFLPSFHMSTPQARTDSVFASPPSTPQPAAFLPARQHRAATSAPFSSPAAELNHLFSCTFLIPSVFLACAHHACLAPTSCMHDSCGGAWASDQCTARTHAATPQCTTPFLIDTVDIVMYEPM
jgi:hypothetical protein